MMNRLRENKPDMRITVLFILYLIMVAGLYSCRASKQITSSAAITLTEQTYIDSYKDISVSEMKRAGIPASITLAQGMIESDYGRSTLAREANNHFGIKCHSDWTGPKVYHHDDKRNDCFRKYSKPEDSFYDHSDFLRSGSRYRFLFDLSASDYKGWALGLKKAGYATNPDYANMLIRKIEENNLHLYDNGYIPAVTSANKQLPLKEIVSVQDSDKIQVSVYPADEKIMVAARVPRVMENNNLRYIIVRDGDTREKLQEEFQLLSGELSRYNELGNDFTITPGQILYLQPKKEKADSGTEFYTTVQGDTMYMISQRYGIKLKSLYKMNRMQENSEPEPGSTIWLRSVKPVN
jgi:LysM repeat protein